MLKKNYWIKVQPAGGSLMEGVPSKNYRLDGKSEDFKDGFITGLRDKYPESGGRRYIIMVEEL